MAAILRGHIEQPQAQILRLALEVGANLRAHDGAVHRMHLDRDELAIDEGPDRLLEQLQFLGKLEVHVNVPGGRVLAG